LIILIELLNFGVAKFVIRKGLDCRVVTTKELSDEKAVKSGYWAVNRERPPWSSEGSLQRKSDTNPLFYKQG
jgi:hypothetical protein